MSSKLIERQGREYSLAVNSKRALAFVGDGLKEGQRIALWMLRNESSKIKTAGLVGKVMASGLYRHGDAALDESITRLAAPYLNNIPLITAVSDCGFGSKINPWAMAQGRYTEIRGSKIAETVLFRDIEIVSLVDNYDRSKQMPESFLPLIPTILLNGVRGTGVGFATLILPRSFDDLVKSVLRVLDGEKVGKLSPKWAKFDVTVKEIETGKFAITGKFYREGSNRIIVEDLPPGVTTEAFKKHLNQLLEEKKIVGYDDHSSEQIKIEIKVSRNYLAEASDENIIALLGLRDSETENLTVYPFTGQHIRTYASPQELLEEWVQWRLTFYEKRYANLIAVERRNLLNWRSMVACFEAGIPKKTSAIPSRKELTKLVSEAISQTKLLPDSEIVDRIVAVPLYRWTLEGEREARDHMARSEKLINEYETIMKSPAKRKAVFREEVASLKAKDLIE